VESESESETESEIDKQEIRSTKKKRSKTISQKGKKKIEKNLISCSLDTLNDGYGTKIPFAPTRCVGTHLPPGVDTSPKGLFQQFFNEDIVNYICNCTDEYAENMKVLCIKGTLQ